MTENGYSSVLQIKLKRHADVRYDKFHRLIYGFKQGIRDLAIINDHARRFEAPDVNVVAQGLGGKKQMLLTIITEVKLGPYRFRKVPAGTFGVAG